MDTHSHPHKHHDVFVSYSSKNKNYADAIVADLEQHGVKCWYAPRDILPGETWIGAINAALRLFSDECLLEAVRRHIPAGTEEINRKALDAGAALIAPELSERFAQHLG